jgi:GNAT superfamily N-acetyltransferase
VNVRLPNGVEVVVRPIRPGDKRLLADGMARMSPDSVHRRFLAPKLELTATELRYLTEVDFRDHLALVAVHADDPATLAGVARWIRDPREPGRAEAAIAVADDLQGHGLGTALGAAIARAARARGVERFTATTLPHNRAAHRLFARLAERLHVSSDGGVHQISAELPA